jgi:hypothetical protein
MKVAIVVASVSGKCLPVMLASCREYAPAVKVYLRTPVEAPRYDVYRQVRGAANNFGADYNEIIDIAFADGYDGVVVANDDVVLTPTSYYNLLDDVVTLQHEVGEPIGWVVSRCDSARPMQNIRSNPFKQELHYFKFPWEDCICPMHEVSPIFGYISRQAWAVAKFPPLNWYSDDVHCRDLLAAGYENFLSRSYVHHVGSQSTGMDGEALTLAAVPWIRENRPEYALEWFGAQQ